MHSEVQEPMAVCWLSHCKQLHGYSIQSAPILHLVWRVLRRWPPVHVEPWSQLAFALRLACSACAALKPLMCVL
jgi:hypothetical protein